MIARIVRGALMEVEAEARAAAWRALAEAMRQQPGFQGVYCFDRPAGEEGMLVISFWESPEHLARAVASAGMNRGLVSFSTIVAAPPSVEYVEVAAWEPP